MNNVFYSLHNKIMWFYCSRGKKKNFENTNARFSAIQTGTKCMFGSTKPTSAFHKLRFCSPFFFHAFWSNAVTVHWTVTANVDFSVVNSTSVYCLWTHKFHFSVTFSLKMGPTALFTHLKIILLQCFSVFSFSFQFSAVSKRTL